MPLRTPALTSESEVGTIADVSGTNSSTARETLSPPPILLPPPSQATYACV